MGHIFSALPGLAEVPPAEKKECLILTNKATMLLKTKDRENEQSQTKPILSRLESGAWGCRGDVCLRSLVTRSETKGYGFFPELARRFSSRFAGSE
jgi:hypothetical protein